MNTGDQAGTFEADAWRELEMYLQGELPDTDGTSALPREIEQALFDLELDRTSGPEDARRAYRRLLRQYHPDRFSGDTERSRTASEVTFRISLAYKRLSDYYQS